MASNEKDIERGLDQPTATSQFARQDRYPDNRHTSFVVNEVASSSDPSQSYTRYPQQSRIVSYQPDTVVPTTHAQHASMLSAFRYHVGIHADPSLVLESVPPPVVGEAADANHKSMLSAAVSYVTAPSKKTTIMNPSAPLARPAPNIGIFRRIVACEENCGRQYKTFAILINGALGLQLIFAAALTALGAGNGPHGAITIFGAMNTVIAGLLTFLKGSGLPNRLKYYENEWRKLREYIEQRERDLASDELSGGRSIGYAELMQEIKNIEQMYESVRQDIEANTPDSYVSMSNALKGGSGSFGSNSNSNGIKQHGINGHGSLAANLTKGLGMIKDKLEHHADAAQHTQDDLHRSVHDLDSNARSTFSSSVQGLHNIRGRFEQGISDIEKTATHNVHEIVDDARDRARDAEYLAESRIRNTQRHWDDRAHSGVAHDLERQSRPGGGREGGREGPPHDP